MLTIYHLHITLSYSAMLGGDTTFTSQVTGSHVHAIENAIRPLFADRVTCLECKMSMISKGAANVII